MRCALSSERDETYQDLHRQKGALETWLSVRQWPKDQEISRMLDRLLLMIERDEGA